MGDVNDNLQHSDHKAFINRLTALGKNTVSKRFKRQTFKRITGIKVSPSFNQIITQNESIIESHLRLHPELIAFLFHMEGCRKNLLLYIIVCKHNRLSGKYAFNKHVVDEFREFSSGLFDEHYSEQTVQQAHRDLVDANITLNVGKGSYFLNPLIIGGNNSDGRRNLVNEYSKLIYTKGKDATNAIYPKYKKRGNPSKNTKQFEIK